MTEPNLKFPILLSIAAAVVTMSLKAVAWWVTGSVGLLSDAADPALLDRWLPRVAAGEVIVTVGLQGMPYVADAHVAGLLLLQQGDELHALEPDAVTVTPQPSVDRARRLFRVAWTPAPGTLVGAAETARTATATAFDRGALCVSAQLLGITGRLIEMAVAYARDRRQFGRPIGSYQAVQHRLADALLHQEFARPVVYQAAASLAQRSPTASRDVSMAKCYAARAATFASRTALQVHGAIGYTDECDLHLWLKRALALAGAWGDVPWHRRRVAAAVL